MRVLFWVPYPEEGASNRYRVSGYLPYLEREGIEYSVHSFWNSSSYKILYSRGHFLNKLIAFLKGACLRIGDLFCLGRYDLVFIHREACPVGGAVFENILSFLKKPIVFDFDDAIFLPSSSRYNNFIEKFKNPNKIVDIIKMSRHVIAGNSYLAEFARCYNRMTSVIPTAIDTKKYTPMSEKSKGKTITIGWIGSITTVDFLKSIEGALQELTKKFPDVRIKIIGGEFKISGAKNVTSKPWSMHEETNDLKTFDIGIMPMPDNSWTKGKCGFKAILYMSLGIPCIASPVGVNKEIISDGTNGFLAVTQDEWIDKISRLINDAELRSRIGVAGRKTVEDRYSLKVNVPKFIEIIKSACTNKG